jgi:hypothetical protein
MLVTVSLMMLFFMEGGREVDCVMVCNFFFILARRVVSASFQFRPMFSGMPRYV